MGAVCKDSRGRLSGGRKAGEEGAQGASTGMFMYLGSLVRPIDGKGAPLTQARFAAMPATADMVMAAGC